MRAICLALGWHSVATRVLIKKLAFLSWVFENSNNWSQLLQLSFGVIATAGWLLLPLKFLRPGGLREENQGRF